LLMVFFSLQATSVLSYFLARASTFSNVILLLSRLRIFFLSSLDLQLWMRRKRSQSQPVSSSTLASLPRPYRWMCH
jgi:hypothetical protein